MNSLWIITGQRAPTQTLARARDASHAAEYNWVGISKQNEQNTVPHSNAIQRNQLHNKIHVQLSGGQSIIYTIDFQTISFFAFSFFIFFLFGFRFQFHFAFLRYSLSHKIKIIEKYNRNA